MTIHSVPKCLRLKVLVKKSMIKKADIKALNHLQKRGDLVDLVSHLASTMPSYSLWL
jgi:hypothetical protein